MATVWLAERHDGLIPRPVALKLPKRSWRKAALRERLTRERDILASLTHPNIARLYDAGITGDGQPYLALEYVEGRRLDEFVRETGLDSRRRVVLFLQVAVPSCAIPCGPVPARLVPFWCLAQLAILPQEEAVDVLVGMIGRRVQERARMVRMN